MSSKEKDIGCGSGVFFNGEIRISQEILLFFLKGIFGIIRYPCIWKEEKYFPERMKMDEVFNAGCSLL